MLIGAGVWLAPGSTTTGSFQNVPPCREPDQAGCVVAYNTYASTPPTLSLFGRTVNGRTVVCVLSGGNIDRTTLGTILAGRTPGRAA